MPTPNFKLFVASLCVVAICASTVAIAQELPRLPQVVIGIVMDGPFYADRDIRAQVESEIHALTSREFDVVFPAENQLVGDWSFEKARNNLEVLLADDNVDIVITGGVLSSHLAATRSELPKPVVATSVLDVDLQQIPYENGVSGKHNLTYILFPNSLERDLAVFQIISPFDSLVVLMNDMFIRGVPDLEHLVQKRPDRGYNRQLVPVSSDISSVVERLNPGTDAVYILPMTHLTNAELTELVESLTKSGYPTFSYMGERGVDQGVLASLNPNFKQRMSRRVALNVQQILLGRDAAEIRVDLVVSERLTINMRTARQLNLVPPLEMMIEADRLVDEQELGAGLLTFEQAIREGVIENLALVAEGQRLEAREQDPRIARSAYLPQIGLSGIADVVDERFASVGLRPQRALSGSLTLSQLIYSDEVFANASVQQRLQTIRQYEQDALYLDVTQDIAVSYLILLQSKSIERIQSANLRVTRTNLDLAAIRESLGQAAAGEVLRWQSKIAQDRQQRIESYGRRRVDELSLSQVMNRPLNVQIATVDVGLGEPNMLINAAQFQRIFENPRLFGLLEDFLVNEGLEHSPELQTIDEALAIQSRLISSANRAFYLPVVLLEGSANKYLAQGGIGSDTDSSSTVISPDFSKGNWNLGVRLSFPLFTGFARSAERTKANLEYEQIQTTRFLASQIIEQQIRSQVQLTGMYYASIDQARKALDAASQSMVLVQDSYANGLADILDLIDAQNTVLRTEEAVSNAIYNFLISSMQTERAIGISGIFLSPEEKIDFTMRLATFVEQNQ